MGKGKKTTSICEKKKLGDQSEFGFRIRWSRSKAISKRNKWALRKMVNEAHYPTYSVPYCPPYQISNTISDLIITE